MTDPSPGTIRRLWTPKGFRDDDWVHADGTQALPGGRVILPLQAFLDRGPGERGVGSARLGVLLQPGEALDAVAGRLGEVALVALAFPAYTDGRSYSKAELLRSRHGFEGAVRATGQVLVDQLPHMLRVGFDEFEVSDPVLIRRLEEGRLDGLPVYSQPSARGAARAGKYSWRRLPAD